MGIKHKPPTKVFINDKGFHPDRPLTKLARELMPRVRIVAIRKNKEYGHMEADVQIGDSDKVFSRYAGGHYCDELTAYQELRKNLEKNGYRVDGDE